MTPTTAAVLPTVPPEVLAFAAEAGVTAELPAVVAMTRRVFPQASLQLVVEEDPEIAGDRHIVIDTYVTGLGVDQAVEATWQWHHGLLASCPAPLAHVFRLGLRMSP